MEQVIQIQTRGGTVLHELDSAIQCRYSDRLSGAPTLHFVTQFRKVPKITADCVLYFGGNYFRITQLQKSVSEGRYLVTVSGEQESVSLTDEKLELFEFTGFASDALSRLLSGTGILGTVETDGVVQIYMQNTNRRAVLLGIASAVGGEIDYRGHTIRIVGHRGSEVPSELTSAKVEDLTRTDTVNGGTEAYVLSCAGAEWFSVGDEVYIREPGLGIDVQRRIIGIQYDPFQDFLRTIEAGDYVPSIVDIYQKTQKAASDAARESATAKDTAKKVEESLKDYVKTSSLSASINTYINEEAGKASIVAALKGTYVEEDALNGYVEKTSLSAEIGAYIDTQAGTAKIVSAASGVYQKIDDMGNYVKTTSLNTSIGQYLNTETGKASIVSAVEGKFVSEADLTGLVKKTELSSSIGQYIDSSTGTSKILAKVSGVYQEKSGMGEYAKATALASIEASVSSVKSEIKLSSSYSENTIGTNVQALLQLVTNANSSSIMLRADKLYFTGTSKFLTAADVGASGTTTIDGARIKTGKISADRIDVDNIGVTTIYGKDTLSSAVAMTTRLSNLYIGGSAEHYGSFSNIYMVVSATVRIGDTLSRGVLFNTNSSAIYPTSAGGYSLGSLSAPFGKLYVGTGANSAVEHNGTNIIPTSTSSISSSYNLGSSGRPWNVLYVKEIYLNGTKLTVSGGSSSGSIGTSSSPVSSAYLGTSSYHLVVSNASIIPNSTSTSSSYYQLGSSSRPFNAIYAKAIYLNGTAIGSGSGGGSTSFAGSTVTLGGTTSYYIVANTSRELRPNTNVYSSYTFYLGTSSYYWHYAYIGSETTMIGSDSSSKLGFFGKTPVTRITVSNSATVAQLISALKSYGLIY